MLTLKAQTKTASENAVSLLNIFDNSNVSIEANSVDPALTASSGAV